LATALLVTGCSGSDDSNGSDASTTDTPAPSDTPSNLLLPGGVGTVRETSAGAPCFYSRDSLDAAVGALVANNKSAWSEEVAAHAIALHAGDRVRRIDTGKNLDTLINVRIESGDNAGAACWFDRASVDLKDVRDDSGQ
jgi:hypothetical protein